MIEDAENRGLLKAGQPLLRQPPEIQGWASHWQQSTKDIESFLLCPEKFSIEKQILMRALGAEIINTPREKGMLGAMEKAKQLRDEIPDSIELAQVVNPANPQIHYEATGAEIYHALNGEIDYLVAGAGSGGTFTGVLRFLKEKNPNIKGILVDPEGSTMGGGEEHCYNIEGIGNDFYPGNDGYEPG